MTKSADRATRRATQLEQRYAQGRLQLAPIDAPELHANGLSALQVTERRSLGLVNQQHFDASRSLASILRGNLLTLFNAVVGGSFIVLIILGQWKDALFGLAVISNVLIGIIQEYSSKRSLDRLALLNAPFARVRRSGESCQIPLTDVVADDLLELRPGDQIPADAIVVAASGLQVDESLLTGESEAVPKPEGSSLLAGSGVLAGSATARVTGVGPETYSNRLTLEARRFSLVSSELRNALHRIVKWITWLLLPVMAIAVNGQMQAVGGWQKAFESGLWVEASIGSIAGIIAMIPQGLVLITSISFALAAVKLARQKVLVQELPAVEGLARVDVICFDKTGTLTEGAIELDAIHPLASGEDSRIRSVLSHFGNHPDANSTTAALSGIQPTGEQVEELVGVPFSSERKWSAFTLQNATEKATWVLGAPEIVLTESSEPQTQALNQSRAFADLGLRTLVLAKTSDALEAENLPSNLMAVAIVTLREKVRSDAHQTLSYFAEQGVSVRIISGDNPATVAAIALAAGLQDPGSPIDGRDLPEDQDALAEILETHKIFGRVSPEQKRNMVNAMQSRGHVVAMTGDGVNDALALKHADLGIAMGSGSAVTRAVSRLVLLDGRFATLPGVVAEGRKVTANIERISRLFLTKTSWAMSISIVFGIALWQFPWLPRQLSAIDGFTIGLPAFALALLPNPRRYQPGFLKRSLVFCIPAGLVVAGSVTALSRIGAGQGWSTSQAQTAVALLLSVTGLYVLSALSRPLTRAKVAIIAVMVVLFIGLFTIPLIGGFFGFVYLPTGQLAAIAVISVVAIAIMEAIQRISDRVR